MSAYLDWNATTPPWPEVLQSAHESAEKHWANPASIHGAGSMARAYLEDTREYLADVLRLQSRDILFTSSGTE
ncbi:MAG: aminotransferase class V-fold PLP-dependent enzyme, partial [Polyangiaceae bacterium]|nr:aminotransferase class V-fold PLP-dependent enzyme [Polyangiaceae bacterium]